MHGLTTLLLALAAATPLVSAHLEMMSPFPLHSKFNPKTPEAIKDYSMTAPLATDGSQFPCKGYINNPGGSPAMDSVATWAAGSAQTFSVSGTATHGGGSCQLSMSYDQGATWTVIHSVMGGCMVEGLTDLPFTLPASAPSGTALFAWSWFNHLGNREMYQNCAVVTVTGGGSGLTGPTPFVANAGVNECKTIEGVDVVFPEPGDSVSFGGAYASTKPTAATGFSGSNCVGPNAKSGASGGGSAAPASSASQASSAAASVVAPSAATTAVGGAATASAVEPSASATKSKTKSRFGHQHLATGSASEGASATASVSAVSEVAAAATASASSAPITCRRRKRSLRRHARDLSI